MNKLEFKTEINATADRVWWSLWNDYSYRKWTKVFSEGSYAVSDWKQGSPIQFLSAEGSGIYGIIEERVENQKMAFKHLGEVKNFVNQEIDNSPNSWSGSREIYMLEEHEGKTTLQVHLDSNDEFASYFNSVFPKALEIVKSQAEVTEIQIEAIINASIEKVWAYWIEPKHIQNWCSASPDWHVPSASNDLKVGGSFVTTMAAKDGSMSFDFGGIYTDVVENKVIKYTMGDGRKVSISFEVIENQVKVNEIFEAEYQNPLDLQQYGWQSILNNFKSYTETH